jgi:hypothetical protein
LVTAWAGVQSTKFVPYCTGLNYGPLFHDQNRAFAFLAYVAVPAIVLLTIVLLTIVLLLLGLAWARTRQRSMRQLTP